MSHETEARDKLLKSLGLAEVDDCVLYNCASVRIERLQSRLDSFRELAKDVCWNYHPDYFAKLPVCVQRIWLLGNETEMRVPPGTLTTHTGETQPERPGTKAWLIHNPTGDVLHVVIGTRSDAEQFDGEGDIDYETGPFDYTVAAAVENHRTPESCLACAGTGYRVMPDRSRRECPDCCGTATGPLETASDRQRS